MAEPPGDVEPGQGSLVELAGVFLKLGVLGFGGPAAHVALMRDELVRRRGWIDDEALLEMVGATNLIPGPNSTELAIHLGHRRAGWRGLLVAGVCFIAPAVMIVGLLAWAYERYGTDPAAADLRYGILPVVIAIVGHALVALGRRALTSWLPALLAGGTAAGFLAGWHELILLLVAGLISLGWVMRGRLDPRVGLLLVLPSGAVGSTTAVSEPTLGRLFVVFVEIGSVLYGSGYVLLAFLQRRLVDDLGWLSRRELLDAITVGQVTPGPLFSTATFVGWQIDGPAGAAAATVGIFAPSFVFVALLGPTVAWMRRNSGAKAFLDGVTAASLGLMAGVLIELIGAAVVDVVTGAVVAAALAVLIRTKLNSAWLVVAGGLIAVVRVVVS